MKEDTLKYGGAQRATCNSRVSLTRVHTHATGQTPPHMSVRGIRAVTWRCLQQLMPQKADVHRGGTFRQGAREDVQSRVVACGKLGE